MVERIFDGLVMLIFVFVALPFADFKERWLRDVVFFSTLLFWGAFLVFLIMALRPTRCGGSIPLLDRLPVRPATGEGLAEHFMQGLDNLRRPRDLLMTLVSSVFIWLTETTKYWFVMHANFEVSFFVLMVMTAVVNLATTLPSSPGYVGVRHAGHQDTDRLRRQRDVAILHAGAARRSVAADYTLGVLFLYRKGLGWRDFARAREAVDGAAPGVFRGTEGTA